MILVAASEEFIFSRRFEYPLSAVQSAGRNRKGDELPKKDFPRNNLGTYLYYKLSLSIPLAITFCCFDRESDRRQWSGWCAGSRRSYSDNHRISTSGPALFPR